MDINDLQLFSRTAELGYTQSAASHADMLPL